MLKAELLEIIRNGENSGIEFTRDSVHPEQLAKEVVALVNFQGGRILLGVDDDGSIPGIQRHNLEEWVMNTITEKVHPAILPYYEEIPIDDTTNVAVLTFPQGNSKPYVRRHNKAEEIFLRIGSTSRQATREQQMRLYEIGGLLHSEVLPISRTSSQQLDISRIDNYIRDVLNDPDIPATAEEWETRLANLGFLTEPNGMATIAGMVLFGKKPRQHLKQSGLRIFAFDGPDKTYKAKLDTTLDSPLVPRLDFSTGQKQVIDKGLVEQALTMLQPFITEQADHIDENLQRDTYRFYPIEAIREILVNALVHRDWTRYVDIEIGVYSDRLQIISPGTLQNSMTIAKMLAGQRYTRNTIIMEIMRDYGYVDFRGMGLRTKVIPSMRKHNGCDPIFDLTEDYLSVILPRRTSAK